MVRNPLYIDDLGSSLFARRIKRLRVEKNICQSTIAEKCRVTRQTVSNWERDFSFPSAAVIIELCEILEVTPNDLLL